MKRARRWIRDNGLDAIAHIIMAPFYLGFALAGLAFVLGVLAFLASLVGIDVGSLAGLSAGPCAGYGAPYDTTGC